MGRFNELQVSRQRVFTDTIKKDLKWHTFTEDFSLYQSSRKTAVAVAELL